ncbi:MAG: hypothetical protein QF741_00235 [Candidatus Peribacteraceae bacterium]|jgi:hypothetical protein|nr:hypothetical protein [Candidatus Peribacteraceae bacterium]MDP7454174.1 hypothetical protein [Candidatus Peribacteraceae bacterium]MDP7645713.1 hypothetical protein [Candidatus Peribacteraceae bacterium]|tara:strand:- start:197 stop:505 length:309 start_codon:yes stop_codon:yes gene_type:complete
MDRQQEFILIGGQDASVAEFVRDHLGKNVDQVRKAIGNRFPDSGVMLVERPSQMQNSSASVYYTDPSGLLWLEGFDHYEDRSRRAGVMEQQLTMQQKNRVDR